MKNFTVIALLLGTQMAQAAPSFYVDDSDLSPGAGLFAAGTVDRVLQPQVVVREAGGDALKLRVVVAPASTQFPSDQGIAELVLSVKDGANKTEGRTDAQGSVVLNACQGISAKVEATLKHTLFSVSSGSSPYVIQADVPCRGVIDLRFAAGTPGNEALSIWRIATVARAKLAATVGLGFWKSPIGFVWPADADYYNWGQVHITKGQQWDVVGHELGHAIYDQADLGQFGGGQHKIDECYSTEMALSEGWASYFSAWLSVDMADPDARFEFMVPRRAPIRFENIPADVCRTDRNEWRVTGFLWDLIDLHADGESSQDTFTRVWQAMANHNTASLTEAVRLLKNAGFDGQVLDALWTLDL